MDNEASPGSPMPPTVPPPVAPPPVLNAASATPPPSPAPVLPPGRPKRPGRGWMVFSLVLLLLLGISFVGNLMSLFSEMLSFTPATTHASGPQLREVLVEDNSSSAKIAIVDVDGLIFGGYVGTGELSPVELIARQLERAKDDPRVKAVILSINSPGGEVLAADEIARTIAEFQDRSSKPVIAAMGGLAASGGYYVAAPCRWIVANDLTLTGSIGVIMHGYNYRGLLDKVGVRPQVFKSGKFKDMLSPSKALDEVSVEEGRMIQVIVNESFDRFKKVIADGREEASKRNEGKGRKLATDWQEYADGRVLSGKQAYEVGFVDETGTFKTAVSRARSLAGVQNANLVRYQLPHSFSDLFRLLGTAEGRAVKLDLGINLPKLEIGRLYYLFVPGAE